MAKKHERTDKELPDQNPRDAATAGNFGAEFARGMLLDNEVGKDREEKSND
ncbi:hypothetical protein [Pseudalkalibacillus caeni]|uniref:hypothetical protein n=1 Tax=Exobacillus caeni TaxID=2574798 RepID=UPI00148537FC|nr:hypothetical protein [Pseudalkalibacillus caeni]